VDDLDLRKVEINGLSINKDELISLIGFVERGDISGLSAKNVLSQMIDSGKSAQNLIKEGNLLQVSDTGKLDKIIGEVISENAKSVIDFKAGKTNALMYLVGQVMKKSAGKANPKLVGELMRRRLTDA